MWIRAAPARQPAKGDAVVVKDAEAAVAAMQPNRAGHTVQVSWAVDRALYARVLSLAARERRKRSQMLGVLVAEAVEARELGRLSE